MLLLFSFSQCKVPPPVDCEILLHKVDSNKDYEESEKEQLAKMQSVLDKVDADMALLNKEWDKLGWDDDKQIGEIDFTISSTRQEDLEFFEDGKVPWVSIDQPQIESLEGKNDLVLPFSRAVVSISYPLTHKVELIVMSEFPEGFTRADLIRKISKAYHDIYQKEEATAKSKIIPPSERADKKERNTTDGIYGIWGYDLSELDLVSVLVFEHLEDTPRLELIVSSKLY